MKIIMEHKIEIKNEIKIIGIKLKATNENNQATKDIPQLWKKFYSENLSKKTYSGDFEVYGEAFFNNPQNPEVQVYIAIE